MESSSSAKRNGWEVSMFADSHRHRHRHGEALLAVSGTPFEPTAGQTKHHSSCSPGEVLVHMPPVKTLHLTSSKTIGYMKSGELTNEQGWTRGCPEIPRRYCLDGTAHTTCASMPHPFGRATGKTWHDQKRIEDALDRKNAELAERLVREDARRAPEQTSPSSSTDNARTRPQDPLNPRVRVAHPFLGEHNSQPVRQGQSACMKRKLPSRGHVVYTALTDLSAREFGFRRNNPDGWP